MFVIHNEKKNSWAFDISAPLGTGTGSCKWAVRCWSLNTDATQEVLDLKLLPGTKCLASGTSGGEKWHQISNTSLHTRFSMVSYVSKRLFTSSRMIFKGHFAKEIVVRRPWEIRQPGWSSSTTNAHTESMLLLTETILPSVGMYAGRLLSRSRVWSVLNVASSLAFSSTLGGLCARQ